MDIYYKERVIRKTGVFIIYVFIQQKFEQQLLFLE